MTTLRASRYFSTKDAAAYLEVSRSTLKRAVRSGKLAAIHVPTCRLFTRRMLDEYHEKYGKKQPRKEV